MSDNTDCELQTPDDYNDGLAPEPGLPPLATSKAGTVEEAEALQATNNVPEHFRGAWYHATYDVLESIDNQHEELTWFTRSPTGGTIWGNGVLQVYVIGSSWNLVGTYGRCEVELAAVEEDSGAVVVEVAKAAGG